MVNTKTKNINKIPNPFYTIDWEDPQVELGAMEEILQHTVNPTILVVGGAGDMVLSLLDNRIDTLICVDKSEAQLALIELKAQLVTLIADNQFRLEFLQGQMNEDEFDIIWEYIKDGMKSGDYWNQSQRRDLLRQGLIKADVWWKLFNELTQNGYNYQSTFGFKRLIKVFGRKYFNFRFMIQPFRYFEKIEFSFCSLQKTNFNFCSLPKTNFNFCSLQKTNFNFCCDNNNKTDSKFKIFSSSFDIPIEKIHYINSDIRKYLMETKRRFHLITISNITDEWSESQIDAFFHLLSFKVRKNGRLITRRMLGDIPLRPIIKKYFIVLEFERPFLVDRSNLFQEVILACPKPYK